MQQLASTGTTVLLLVIVLVGLGVAMVWLAVWLTRSTRTDAPALGPLEAMGARRFRRGDESAQTARLADARPAGAPDRAPIVAFEELPIADGDAVETEAEVDQPKDDAAEQVEQEPAAEPAEPSEVETEPEEETEEAVASSERPVKEAPASEEPAPAAEAAPDAPPVVASVLMAPSPLELETDEDEPLTDQRNGPRVEEPR